jgi:hypothetical protein
MIRRAPPAPDSVMAPRVTESPPSAPNRRPSRTGSLVSSALSEPVTVRWSPAGTVAPSVCQKLVFLSESLLHAAVSSSAGRVA